jgi:uncharacterized protein
LKTSSAFLPACSSAEGRRARRRQINSQSGSSCWRIASLAFGPSFEPAVQTLEEGDVEEAMKAAEAIGDDRLQRRSQGYVVPDSFTHGSSEQRVRWFMTGMKGGEIRQCDTFRENQL